MCLSGKADYDDDYDDDDNDDYDDDDRVRRTFLSIGGRGGW